jgi:hypothetical protein
LRRVGFSPPVVFLKAEFRDSAAMSTMLGKCFQNLGPRLSLSPLDLNKLLKPALRIRFVAKQQLAVETYKAHLNASLTLCHMS